MKSITEYLTFNVPARMAFLNITSKIEEIVEKSGVQEGLVLCNAMHITASVFINDDESGLHADYKKWLEKLAPFDASPQTYAHNRTGEDNADAHMKRQIMGREVVVAITKGKLDFGPWEQIFYGEFDGHRPKRVLVKVLGEWYLSHSSSILVFPAKVLACLRPGYLTVIVGNGLGLADGGIPQEISIELVPFDLRMPNSQFKVIIDRTNGQFIGVERLGGDAENQGSL